MIFIYYIRLRGTHMIGKYSRVKEINNLYCVSLLPDINNRSLSLHNQERSSNKTTQKSPKKDKTLTLQKIKQKLRRQIDEIESTSIGNIQKSLLAQNNPTTIANKILDTSYISYNSRIHAITDSPVFNSQKGKSLFKRQTLYPHKVRTHTEQSKKQIAIKERQLPAFSIKLLRAFLKQNQKLIQNDSISLKVQSSPISKLCDTPQIKAQSNSKNLQQLEMNTTDIQIKNSKYPRRNQEFCTNLPCFIVKRTPQNCRQPSKKRILNFNPTIKTNTKKSYLSQRDHQLSECPETQMKKKFSQQIENDLMQLSTPRNCSLLRKSTHTEPSLSAWQ